VNRNSIYQTCRKFAVIDAASNEWLKETGTYRDAVLAVREVVQKGREYVIVAVLKEAEAK
jgi:hypothetical protein